MITRLITDRDVQLGLVSPPLVLDEHTILTPAGRDRAVQKGWAIVEKGAVAAHAASPGAPPSAAVPGTSGCGCPHGGGGQAPDAQGACPCPRLPDGLADGTYLVRLQDGRVASVLPASGPGQMLRAR